MRINYENMTSSAKHAEVRNIFNCRQRILTNPRPQATYTENLVKFRHVVFEKCQRTYRYAYNTCRQTHKHANRMVRYPARD